MEWRPLAFIALYALGFAIWIKWLCEWQVESDDVRKTTFQWSLPICLILYWINVVFWVSSSFDIELEMFVLVSVVAPIGCPFVVAIVRDVVLSRQRL
jgi:hypothetical protein